MKFKTFFKFKKIRLRQNIRAYNYLSKNKKLHIINLIFLECISNPIKTNNKENKIGINEHSLNQYLVVRLFNQRLISSLLLGYMNNHKKIVCMLPSQWIDIIEKNGIKVNRFLSGMLYFGLCFLYFGYGVKTFFKLLFCNLPKLKNDKYNVDFHFHKLHPNNISNSDLDKKQKNVVNWFKEKHSQNINITFSSISSNDQYPNYTKDKIINDDIISLNLLERAKYFCLGFKTIITAFLNLTLGNLSLSIMLHELMLLIKTQCHSKNVLAKEYLFNNTSYMYRPLWTYEAERRGAKITLYFYSANIEPPIIDNFQCPIYYGYKVMSWPNYLVWNKSHANFIRGCNDNKTSIEIVGPIYFSDITHDKLNIPKRSIAVFDITPYRLNQISSIVTLFNYYNSDITVQFLKLIQEMAYKNNFTILFKSKRDLDLLGHKAYIKYKNKYQKLNNVIKIDSEINAYHIIKNVKGVISMPFTSTDIIAKDLNIPSIFFDPTKRMKKRNMKNIENETKIIFSLKELDLWFKSLVNNFEI